MKLDKRFRNKAFWVAAFSLIAITGQVFGIYKVPDGWDAWVNSVLLAATALGVFIDPTTPGITDK